MEVNIYPAGPCQSWEPSAASPSCSWPVGTSPSLLLVSLLSSTNILNFKGNDITFYFFHFYLMLFMYSTENLINLLVRHQKKAISISKVDFNVCVD